MFEKMLDGIEVKLNKDYFKDIMNSNYLVLVRHGQSEWNEKNLFTGWRDPGLTAKGVREAHAAGKALKKKNIILSEKSKLLCILKSKIHVAKLCSNAIRKYFYAHWP